MAAIGSVPSARALHAATIVNRQEIWAQTNRFDVTTPKLSHRVPGGRGGSTGGYCRDPSKASAGCRLWGGRADIMAATVVFAQHGDVRACLWGG